MSDVGLCASCKHAKVIATRRGSTFYLCLAAEWVPSLQKYPPLPVRQCVAHEKRR